MEVTTKELRIQPGKIIDQVSIGQEIIVTYRGKPLARIIPFQTAVAAHTESPLFGMWKDHSTDISVEDQVREMRKGRSF